MPDVYLNGPSTIDYYKNITANEAGGELVYMGEGGHAPAKRGDTGVHPGRWVDPGRPGAVSTTGGVGHFLAVATDESADKVGVGSVVALYQQGHFSHLAVVASEQHYTLGAGSHPYSYFRWAFVLAMSRQIPLPIEAAWPFNLPGGCYIRHGRMRSPQRHALRQQLWEAFIKTPNHLLDGTVVQVPKPPGPLLSYPATYP